MKMFVSGFLFKSLHSALVRGATWPSAVLLGQMLHRYGVDLLQVAQFGGEFLYCPKNITHIHSAS